MSLEQQNMGSIDSQCKAINKIDDEGTGMPLKELLLF